MTFTQDHVEDLAAAEVVDRDGSNVGKVGQVYLDDETGSPAWVTVKTGLFGTKESFVPLADASLDNGQVRVAHDKDTIKDAPNADADQHLSEQQQDELYRYYRLDGGVDSGRGGVDDGRRDEAVAGTTGAAGAAGGAAYGGDDQTRRDDTVDRGRAGDLDRDVVGEDRRHDGDGVLDDGADRRGDGTRTPGRAGDSEGSMTLHEEQVNVGTERVETGRMRLRKHVVTDERTVTVPVEREEYELVREPVADGETTGGQLGDDEIEVAVHEERPVVEKDVVATEEVGLQRNTTTEERDVTTDVSHEEVDVVDDDRDRDGRRG